MLKVEKFIKFIKRINQISLEREHDCIIYYVLYLFSQQIAFKNLVQRNKKLEETGVGPPTSNSAIHLPYIIVNTSKKTVIDCSISNDK